MVKILLFMASILSISSCVITGPAEDQWDQEEKAERFELNNVVQTNNESETKSSFTLPQTTDFNNGQMDDQFKEFLRYQAWQREQDTTAQTYQEFKRYLQWTKEQAASKK